MEQRVHLRIWSVLAKSQRELQNVCLESQSLGLSPI